MVSNEPICPVDALKTLTLCLITFAFAFICSVLVLDFPFCNNRSDIYHQLPSSIAQRVDSSFRNELPTLTPNVSSPG